MRILHISDLHASALEAKDQIYLVEALLSDLADRFSDQSFDVVAFTGDLAFAGTPEEFGLGQELLLDPLQAQLGLARDQMLVVPGNHDVNRAYIDEAYETGLRLHLDGVVPTNKLLDDAGKLPRATERLKDWSGFEVDYYDGVGRHLNESLGWFITVSDDSWKTRFVALNSAWRCSGGPADRSLVIVGDRQMRAQYGEEVDLNVVLVHHPVSWLAPWDGDDFRQWAEQGDPTLVLTGHEHQVDASKEITPRGQAIYSRAGCLFESLERKMGYTVVDVQGPEPYSFTFSARTWNRRRAKFVPDEDLGDGGVFCSSVHQSSGTPTRSLRFSDVMTDLVTEVYERSVVADQLPESNLNTTIDDLLVPPRFFAIPYEDARAAARAEPDARPEPVNGASIVIANRVTIVCGDTQSGVSSALYWLEARWFETAGNAPPIRLKYDPQFKESRFERQLRATAERFMSLPNDALPPLLVAVDDVDPSRLPALRAFLRYIARHPELHVVIGCNQEHADSIANEAQRLNVPTAKIFLGPFGRAQVRNLIVKFTGHEDDNLLSRVLAFIASTGLPRTPFVIATLVAVSMRQRDLPAINESGLLSTYASFLLTMEPDGLIDAQNMDETRRDYVLSWFAGKLVADDVESLPRMEVETSLAAQFSALGWGSASSPGLVVEGLVRRRILVSRNGQVEFRHLGFRDFFAAKLARREPDFAELVLKDAVRNARIVAHSAGLARDDRALLARVKSVVGEIIERTAGDVSPELFEAVRDKPGWSQHEDLTRLKRMVEVVDEAGETQSSEYDEAVDQFYDDLDEIDGRPSVEAELPPVEAVARAVALLASVLKSSELVDDLGLKRQAYRDAIDGFSRAMILLAFKEDQTGQLRDVLAEEIGVFESPEVANRLMRIADLIVVLIVTLGARTQLGSVHLEDVMRHVLEDDKFMADAANALLATEVYCGMRMPQWTRYVEKLVERHGAHPVVRRVIEIDAIIAHRLERPLARPDQVRLEEIVFRVAVVDRGGHLSRTERAELKSEIVRELRKSRRRIEPGDVGGLDELDIEPDEGDAAVGALPGPEEDRER